MNILEGLITIIQQNKQILSKLKGSNDTNNTTKVNIKFCWKYVDRYTYLAELYIDNILYYYNTANSTYYQGEEVAEMGNIPIPINVYNKLYDAVSNNNYEIYSEGCENFGINIYNNEIRIGDVQGNYLYIGGTIVVGDTIINIPNGYNFIYEYIDDKNSKITYIDYDGIHHTHELGELRKFNNQDKYFWSIVDFDIVRELQRPIDDQTVYVNRVETTFIPGGVDAGLGMHDPIYLKLPQSVSNFNKDIVVVINYY